MLSHRKFLYINQMDNPISNNLFVNDVVVPMLSINRGNKLLNMNMVTEYDSNNKKRRYLSDLKPFSNIFTLRSISLELFKAFLLPFSLVVQEHNSFVISQSLNKNDEDSDNDSDNGSEEDFDWKQSIQRHQSLIFPLFIKNISVKILYRFILEQSKQLLSARVIDKLSKDVYRSLLRKISRFHSRFYTSYCIFFTYYKSTLVFNMSLCLYDLGCNIYEAFYMERLSTQQKGFYVLKSMFKRSISYYLCSLSAALGYAVGSYWYRDGGGTLGSMCFELLGSTVIQRFLF